MCALSASLSRSSVHIVQVSARTNVQMPFFLGSAPFPLPTPQNQQQEHRRPPIDSSVTAEANLQLMLSSYGGEPVGQGTAPMMPNESKTKDMLFPVWTLLSSFANFLSPCEETKDHQRKSRFSISCSFSRSPMGRGCF